MTLIARTTACLRFFGDDLDPENLTTLLGCLPSGAERKGEVIKSQKSGRERTVRTGAWRLEVEDRVPGDLDGQITEIFSQLTSDVSRWRQLAKFGPSLFVGFFMEDSNEMIELSSASLSLLADRGVDLMLDVYDPCPDMSNVQVIDDANNATFSIFQATPKEFVAVFPSGQDMEFAEDVVDRIGEARAKEIFDAMWERPILKREADGIHGTLYFNYAFKRGVVPASKA